MLYFIQLFVSSRRYAAEEYVKSTRKGDFTYFPSAENKARFGDYFSKSKWKKSSHGLTLREAALAGQQAQSLVERVSAEGVLYSVKAA